MRVALALKAAALALAAVFTFAPQSAHAAGLFCTIFYVIQPGDTLSKIARLSYGSGDYQIILSRNLDVLKNIHDLPAGQVLLIPCPTGTEPAFNEVVAEQAAAAVSRATEQADVEANVEAANAPDNTEVASVEQPQAVETPAPAQPEQAEPSPQSVIATAAPATLTSPVDRLKLLTASGLAPFSDKSLRGGGMATELANRSLEKLGIKEASRIVYIDDRDSHLQDLLIDGSFDLGYPWFRPACEKIDILEEISPDDAWLCKNFTFSETFYEFVYGFFVPKGEYSLSRTTFDDFAESRICRPAGPSLLDLAVNGVNEAEATFIRPDTLEECFALLQAGEVDAVSGEAFEAENLLASQGLFDTIEELPNLGLLQTVHAVAPIGKPGADEAIAALNTGLIELKVSGEWFRIVGRHLAKN